MEKYNDIIIGFGKGGKTLASELASHGHKVAVVERSDRMYGGTCINTGCIPTKALVHQAEIAEIRQMASFDEKQEFYRHAVEFKEDVVETLRRKNYHNLADNPNITVLTGEGSFTGPDEVQVILPEGTLRLKAERIFINTGAETILPPIPGIENNPRVFTSTSILDLFELPRRLVIVGGGYIGLEYASIYASFGSQVTVLEGAPEFIPREDRDIAAAVKKVLEEKGIVFRLSAKVLSVENDPDSALVHSEDSATGKRSCWEADAVLLATGRKPATAGLNLGAAGVETDERGAIRVNDKLHTTAPNIYALGDVKGGLQFTYISLDDYRIVREELFGDGTRSTSDRNPTSYSVFISPPLARIGLSETEARAKGLDVRIKTLPVAAIPRARTLGWNAGLLKAVIDAQSDEILGCTLFGPEASEVINTVAVAMKARRKASFLRDFIFTHPSMSEAMNELFA